MKKLTLASVGIMGLCAVVLGASTVDAARNPDKPVANTEATVQFEVDNGKEPPVTPPIDEGENGGGTVKPERPGTDGQKGDGDPSFNITHVSNFRFNEKEAFVPGNPGTWTWKPIKLNANGMNLYAYGTDLTLYRQNGNGEWINAAGDVVTDEKDAQLIQYQSIPNFIQVTDNRGNKNAGWKLDVKRTQFSDGKGNDLTGATMTLNDLSLKGPDQVTAPTVEDPAGGFEIPLDTEGTKPLMNAAKATGTGSWQLSFGKQSADTTTLAGTENDAKPVKYKQLELVNGKPKSGVNLTVPAAAQAQTGVVYTSTITWTLSNVPG